MRAVVYMPVVIRFYHMGPTFGWGAEINGHRCVRFTQEGGVWVPKYFKPPSWMTRDDMEGLADMLTELLEKQMQEGK